MNVQITVRNVPAEVRDALASRAARKGQSMQEYLRQELERMAARPTVQDVSESIRQRKARSSTRLTAADALYVAIAECLDMPLATLDRKLADAAGPGCRFLLPEIA